MLLLTRVYDNVQGELLLALEGLHADLDGRLAKVTMD